MKEQEIIEVLKKDNEEFKNLSQEHQELDSLLVEMDKRVYLSPEEEVERKKIQKQKLLKKDRMAEIIRDYKSTLS